MSYNAEMVLILASCNNQSVQRRRGCACMKLLLSGVYFYTFLTPGRIVAGPPVGPITAINSSNDTPRLELHS